MSDIFVCPYISNNPYYVGCVDGYIMLLPSKVKCEYRCAAWQDNKCIRLSEGKESCSCNGDTNADKFN